jgi:tRNA pseudouridine38-40 synthase
VIAETLYAAGLVAYDGTDFHGFQYQVGVPTVQGTLENALGEVCQPLGRVVAAGRTDSGVHANGQVVAVRVHWRHGVEQLQRAWNAHLPNSISVRRMQAMPESFHPRFSARLRTYRYTLMQPAGAAQQSMPNRSPLTDRFSWFVKQPLDVASMEEASAYLVGEHDFATFGQPTQGESTVRTVTEVSWQREESTVADLDVYPGRRLVLTITANGFLRQMVRTVTATLVQVGLGSRQPRDIKWLLEQRDRSLSAAPAPGAGLSLELVQYPKGHEVLDT